MAKKILLILIIVTYGNLSIYSQLDPEWAFNPLDANAIGGNVVANAIATDSEGNSYITGYFEATADFDPGTGKLNKISAGFRDIFIAKYNTSGNYIWVKTLGSTSNEEGLSISIDNAGNICFTGYFNGSVNFNPGTATTPLNSNGVGDIFIAKFDGNGNYIWAKNIGGAGEDKARSIVTDPDNNIYLAGSFNGTVDFDPGVGTASIASSGQLDGFIAKYDLNGNYISAFKIGTNADEEVHAIQIDANRNVFATGYFQFTTDFDPAAGTTANLTASGIDVFIAKYNSNFTYANAFKIGGSGGDYGNALAIDGDGNIAITGYVGGTAAISFNPAGGGDLTPIGGNDIYVAKYSNSLVYSWAKLIGGSLNSNNDQGKTIVTDVSGNIYLSGFYTGTADFNPGVTPETVTSNSSSQDIFIAKYLSDGTYSWVKSIGGIDSDMGLSMVYLNNGVHVAGSFKYTAYFNPDVPAGSELIAPSAFMNGFFAKYSSSDGTYSRAGQIGTYGNATYSQNGRAVKTDNLGNVYMVGEFKGAIDFDPGEGTALLTANGTENDIFITKYNSTGSLSWAKSIGGTLGDVAYSIDIDSNNDIYVTGYFNGTVDFDPNAGTYELTSVGSSNDIFIAKYSSAGDFVFAKQIGGSGWDVANSIAVDANKNIYITGRFYGTCDFNPDGGTVNDLTAFSGTDSDIFIAKYNQNGNYIFATAINNNGPDDGKSVVIDSEGNSYLTGYRSYTGQTNVLLAGFNSSGNLSWSKNIGSTTEDKGNALVLGAGNSLLVTGVFSGTVDFNPGGTAANLISSGQTDIFLAKYDNSGNCLFAKKIGGTAVDVANSIATDAIANIFISGSFSGSADFDPGSSTFSLTSVGNTDVFVAKYDESGNYVGALGIGGTSGDVGYSMDIDLNNYVLITGAFQGTADFDPSTETLNLQSLNTIDIFLAKYKQVQEIHVLGNSLNIVNGDNTPSLTDFTDFGSTGIGSTIIRTFEIKNIGGANLLLTGTPRVQISGTGFSLNTDAPSSITPGNTASFSVSFTPASIELLTGTVSIACNDSDENPFTFSISGTGTKISQTITNFAIVSPKTYGDQAFTVSATGGGSGNPVVFTSQDPTVASCSGTNGSTITILKPGTVKIYANQTGNATYSDAVQVEQTLVINAKVLTVSGIYANNKIYDITPFATLSGTATLQGVVGSDDAILVTGTINPLFNDKNIGIGKPVTVYGYSISGSDASKYTFPNPVFYADITPVILTISGLDAENKEYDATNTAIVNGTAQLNGVLGGENVSLFIENPGAFFNNKNAGINKQVFLSGYRLNGNSDTTNYNLDLNSGLMADIMQKELNVSGIQAENKEYDGTTIASFTGGILDGIISEDQVNIASILGEFATATVGTGISVTIASITIGGTDGGNYKVVSMPVGLTADIIKATPLITWANPANILSGTALSSTQLNATASTPGTFVYTPPSGTVLSVGNNQELKVDFTPTDQANYNTAGKSVYINVLPSTGIEVIDSEIVKIYPNPASEKISVEGLLDFENKETVQLIITDMKGKMVFFRAFNHPNQIEYLDINRLSMGTYQISFRTSKKILNKNFIKI